MHLLHTVKYSESNSKRLIVGNKYHMHQKLKWRYGDNCLCNKESIYIIGNVFCASNEAHVISFYCLYRIARLSREKKTTISTKHSKPIPNVSNLPALINCSEAQLLCWFEISAKCMRNWRRRRRKNNQKISCFITFRYVLFVFIQYNG